MSAAATIVYFIERLNAVCAERDAERVLADRLAESMTIDTAEAGDAYAAWKEARGY